MKSKTTTSDNKSKMTSLERKWVLYDVGNSAFTMLTATIMPIYFNHLASTAGISNTDYLAYWGYATSISTIIVAVFAPALGTMSDAKGRKKIFFMISALLGCIGCILLGFMQHWLWFLLLFVITKSAYSLSLVFYDAMLPDVTTEERVDDVSAQGFAWGYIGSCVPFVASVFFATGYKTLGISMPTAMFIAFALTAVWWLLLTLPLFKAYRQIHYVEVVDEHPLSATWHRLAHIFSELKENKQALFFLISFFFYIDGVYTIINMATAYGEALGFTSTSLLLALLLTQVVAFPSAILFGKLAKKYLTSKLIRVCIFAYFLIGVYAIFLDKPYEFWVLAFSVGLFQGAIQSLSRSYFTKIIPAEKSGEYFGIYDICGKGAAFVGTFVVSFVTQLTNNMHLGVAAIVVLFIIGIIFFQLTAKVATKNV